MAATIGRMILAPIDGTNERWDVTAECAKGTALTQGGKSGVALGNSGGSTFSKTIGPITISGPAGAAGYAALEVGVHRTGTFEFAVTGVTTGTAQEAAVYIKADGELTLTDTGNTLFGYVNYPKGYKKAAGKAPVKIGA